MREVVFMERTLTMIKIARSLDPTNPHRGQVQNVILDRAAGVLRKYHLDGERIEGHAPDKRFVISKEGGPTLKDYEEILAKRIGLDPHIAPEEREGVMLTAMTKIRELKAKYPNARLNLESIVDVKLLKLRLRALDAQATVPKQEGHA